MTVTATEIDAMLAGAAEFLHADPPDTLTAEITALAGPDLAVIPATRPRVRYWMTIEAGHAQRASSDDAGHLG